MFLCDHILFWAQHRERPVIAPGSFDEAIFNLAVNMSVAFRAAAIRALRALAAGIAEMNKQELKNGASE